MSVEKPEPPTYTQTQLPKLTDSLAVTSCRDHGDFGAEESKKIRCKNENGYRPLEDR